MKLTSVNRGFAHDLGNVVLLCLGELLSSLLEGENIKHFYFL